MLLLNNIPEKTAEHYLKIKSPFALSSEKGMVPRAAGDIGRKSLTAASLKFAP